jgi:hypothetical protein
MNGDDTIKERAIRRPDEQEPADEQDMGPLSGADRNRARLLRNISRMRKESQGVRDKD